LEENMIRSSSIRLRPSIQMKKLREVRRHKSMHTTEGLIRIHHDVMTEVFERLLQMRYEFKHEKR